MIRSHAAGAVYSYIGTGGGIAFVDSNTPLGSRSSPGGAWLRSAPHRLVLDGRPRGPLHGNHQSHPGRDGLAQNQTVAALAGIAFKFGAPPSAMVFFDWDRPNLSAQALNTIKQAAAAYKTKGNARISATGHTETSGPEAYNMTLSCAGACDCCHRSREAGLGQDRGRCPRAAEPPRRDRLQ